MGQGVRLGQRIGVGGLEQQGIPRLPEVPEALQAVGRALAAGGRISGKIRIAEAPGGFQGDTHAAFGPGSLLHPARILPVLLPKQPGSQQKPGLGLGVLQKGIGQVAVLEGHGAIDVLGRVKEAADPVPRAVYVHQIRAQPDPHTRVPGLRKQLLEGLAAPQRGLRSAARGQLAVDAPAVPAQVAHGKVFHARLLQGADQRGRLLKGGKGHGHLGGHPQHRLFQVHRPGQIQIQGRGSGILPGLEARFFHEVGAVAPGHAHISVPLGDRVVAHLIVFLVARGPFQNLHAAVLKVLGGQLHRAQQPVVVGGAYRVIAGVFPADVGCHRRLGGPAVDHAQQRACALLQAKDRQQAFLPGNVHQLPPEGGLVPVDVEGEAFRPLLAVVKVDQSPAAVGHEQVSFLTLPARAEKGQQRDLADGVLPIFLDFVQEHLGLEVIFP